MQCPPALTGVLALGLTGCLVGCVSARGRLDLATLEGVYPPFQVIQRRVETRNCTARLLSLIPLSGLGQATPEATLRRTLTRFPDGNGLSQVSLSADYRNYGLLLDRYCWTVHGDVAVVE